MTDNPDINEVLKKSNLFHYFMTVYISWVQDPFDNQVNAKANTHLQSWTNVLGHFCVSGAFSNLHRSNPSPHPTNNVRRVNPEFFSEFLFWFEGGRTARKFRKRMHCFKRKPRIDRKTLVLQYCPKDFCPGLWFWNHKWWVHISQCIGTIRTMFFYTA